jgi:integrase
MAVNSPCYLLKKGSGYYSRIKIPKDLKHRFSRRSEYRFPLRTAQLTHAKSKARLIAGFLQWIFRNIRQGGYLSMLSEQELDELIRKYINELLDEDLRMRLEYPKLYQIDDPEDDPDYHDWMRGNIHGDMLTRRGKTIHQLINYDFSEVSQEVEKILADAGIEQIAPESPTFNKICQRLLQHYVKYWEVIADRVMGKHLTENLPNIPVGQPYDLTNNLTSEITPHQPTQGITFKELADSYWKERVASLKPRSQENYRTYRNRILEFFEEDTMVHTIDYYKCKDFRDWIKASRKPPLSPKKVNDYMDFFRGMLNFELKTTRTLQHNPAEGVRDKEIKSDQEKKPPFDIDDLELIFVRSDEYGQDKFRKAHQFWIPLLALYTGARLEELCQLVAGDIQEFKGIWVVDINEWDEFKSIKTGERRKVPIHPFLLELGFHRYAESRSKEGQLFDLNYVKNRWSHNYVMQFKKFKDKAGIDPTPRWKTFYSLRHTVSQRLKELEVPEVYAADLLGHKHHQITYGLYGSKSDSQMLLEVAVRKLDFHEQLDFSHLLRSKWAKP